MGSMMQSQSPSQGPVAGLFDGYPEAALPGTFDEQEPLAGAAVHDVLTHVVDEVHEICGTLGRELLGAG